MEMMRRGYKNGLTGSSEGPQLPAWRSDLQTESIQFLSSDRADSVRIFTLSRVTRLEEGLHDETGFTIRHLHPRRLGGGHPKDTAPDSPCTRLAITMKQTNYDAIIIGAGFAGIYQLYKLLGLGLECLVLDAAGDVGGTWYWNRYPGAMSDTEAYIYRFSWDKEDLLTYPWDEHYVKQPDVLKYLEHVVRRHDLRRYMQFHTEMRSANYDDTHNRWVLDTSTGEIFTCRFLVTALGLLSKQNYPAYPGIDRFAGERYHTGNWPAQHDFKGKRVGVIGNGSTGVQVITAIAKEVKQLVCFQRTPQYSVPAGDGPVSKEYREKVNRNYDEIFAQVKNSIVAFGFEESRVPAMSVSEEERERVFQDAWDKGNGFRFMFWTFCDLTYDEAANEAACKFIRKKIAEIVTDEKKRAKLTPKDFYARRPLCDAGYYQQFNRDNVDIVDLKETPITEITPHGIRTADGVEHPLDVIIFATGFDAVDGNYIRVAIRGRDGQSLKEHWAATGPTSYMGVCVPNFPNMFMITGPNGPFTNIPPTIETQVEFVAQLIEEGLRGATATATPSDGPPAAAPVKGADVVIEATAEAEQDWTALCKSLSDNSLFKKTDSWIFGANVPGKTHTVMFFFGGLADYRRRVKELADDGYKGFKQPFVQEKAAAPATATAAA